MSEKENPQTPPTTPPPREGRPRNREKEDAPVKEGRKGSAQ